MSNLPIPDNDNILVELKSTYAHIATTEKKYDTKTRGVCLSVSNKIKDEYKHLVGKVVYWESYKDDTQVEVDGKQVAFIKAEYVQGHEDDQAK
jgi:hypothetical protein